MSQCGSIQKQIKCKDFFLPHILCFWGFPLLFTFPHIYYDYFTNLLPESYGNCESLYYIQNCSEKIAGNAKEESTVLNRPVTIA